MVTHLFLPSPLHSIITLLLLLLFVPKSYCEENKDYLECSKPFSCGKLENLQYPFWSDQRPEICGYEGFRLQCADDEFPKLTINDQEFRVLSVNDSEKEMTIARMDYLEDACPGNLANTTMNETLFSYNFMSFPNISLFYDCNSTNDSLASYRLPCSRNGFYASEILLKVWEVNVDLLQCSKRVEVPVPLTALEQRLPLEELLKKGFNVTYNYDEENCRTCMESGGICGSIPTTSVFTCLCRDQSYSSRCSGRGKGPNVRVKVAIGIGTSFGSVIIMCIIFYIYLRRKKKAYAPSSYVSQSMTSDFSSSKSDIERGSIYYGVHLFTYGELEEATNNFDSAKELGEGGFGTVYYGKLRDGRAVAVKRLYENNYKRVEQFMNEVDILTRLRHRNLVSLYGCTSRHSRELLLVYEYISNGTVADHLHGEKAKPGALPWSTRMKIAAETASALAYLHASDIIHRDVKTNNILLDDNFCVKVADFGLSRLFPMDVTHISTAPQGTPGYVDPEYHQCYQLTDKSDVYSFGVVLIELISSMPAVDITRHRHEINLSNMAINKIQSGQLDELVDQSLGFQSDYAIRKMINAVAELAFQCLQSEKDLRPCMEEVVKTLKEIETNDYNLQKAEEMDIPSDDVGLLKSGPQPLSPDTVMMNWTSHSTTPNFSG